MFQHAGNCYAALPKHVAGDLPRISVSTSAPVQVDQANVQTPFWEGMDLALAFIDKGAIDERCTASLGDLNPTATTRNAALALMLRVNARGEDERLPIRVINRDYLYFTGELVEDRDAIAQGTSGSFAFVNDKPIGMAIESDGEAFATFIRSEEIFLNINRFLSEQGRAFSSQSSGSFSQESGTFQGLPFAEFKTNSPASLPQYGLRNVTSDGLFVTDPSGPVVLMFRLEASSTTPVSRVRITSPSNGPYAVPKVISVSLAVDPEGTRFRPWTEGEMRPDGFFDTGRLAPRNARWVQITIRSAWNDGDLALNQVSVQ